MTTVFDKTEQMQNFIYNKRPVENSIKVAKNRFRCKKHLLKNL